jgi:small subunit ribosomal protein S8
MTDPIADMLTRIRNANSASHDTVDVPASKQKTQLARILKQEGYIDDYEEIAEAGPGRSLRIHLRYAPDRTKTIAGIRRISKPGLRVYTTADKLPKVLGGMGTAILSTSVGVMTDREARRKRVGGEVIAYIW